MTALFAAGVVSCATQPFRGETGIRPFAFDLWDIHCPSGLRVIFERAPGSQRAGVTTIVGAGSAADPIGREGLAHLVEHLAFRTVMKPEGLPWNLRVAALGAVHNGFTEFDDTHYFTFVPQQSLAELLALEGQRFLAPLAGVDDATFVVERDVVLNELREHYEGESLRATHNAALRATLPADHPYARPGIGTHGSIEATTFDDARRFVAAHYRPDQMTMIVVGDMEPAASEAFVRAALPPALYGDPSARHPHAPPPQAFTGPPPLAPAHGLDHAHAAVESPELWIAWSMPAGFGREQYLADAWDWIASSNFQRGRLDDDDVSDVSFMSRIGLQASLFMCRVRLTSGKHAQESARQVLEALPWIGGDEVYLDERVSYVKLNLLRELAFDAENAIDRSEERASYAHFVGNPSAYGAKIEAIKSITGDDVRAFAKNYLGRENARLVLVEPYAEDSALPVPVAASKDLVELERRAPLPSRALGNLTALRHFEGLRTVTFDNGLEAIFLRRAGSPVVTASLAFHGGSSAAKAGVVGAAHEAITPNWQESPGDFGIWFSLASSHDGTTATIRSGAGNLVRALDMLSFATRSYDLDWPSDKFAATKLPQLRRRDAYPPTRGDHLLWNQVLAGHAYGDDPTADQIAAATKSEISTWLDRTIAPKNAALVVVGDVDVAEAEAAARSAFGGWTEAAGALPAPPGDRPRAASPPSVAVSGGTSVILTPRPGASQADVRAICLLPPADGRATAVYDIAAQMLGATLETLLREQTGSTYGVRADASTLRGGTALIDLEMAVDNRRLPLALGAVREFWGSIAANGAGAEAVTMAKNDLARARLTGVETSAELARSLVWAWNHGWPLTWADDVSRYLLDVTEDEVSTALRACAKSQLVSIVGDERIVRAALVARPVAEKTAARVTDSAAP